jgi:hypothetical protein
MPPRRQFSSLRIHQLYAHTRLKGEIACTAFLLFLSVIGMAAAFFLKAAASAAVVSCVEAIGWVKAELT